MYIMLAQDQAEQFSHQYQTSSDNILKEHYQMYLLNLLFGSNLGTNLVFKGGTALKLVYNSFRFSEDLDFSLTNLIQFRDFSSLISRIPRLFPEAKIKDLDNKKSTLFARVCFTVNFKPIPIGIKIEVNKQIKKDGYQVALIKSVFNNLNVTGNVYTLREIQKDKVRLLKERREPRDLFDLWYISQKLGQEFSPENKNKYSKKEVEDKLNPFVPKNYKNILSLFYR